MSDMKKWDGWKQQGQRDKNETGGTLGAVEKRKQEGMKNLEKHVAMERKFGLWKSLKLSWLDRATFWRMVTVIPRC